MFKKALIYFEKKMGIRRIMAFSLLLLAVLVIIDIFVTHFLFWPDWWSKHFNYPEKAYESLEQSILSTDDIWNEEFQNKYTVEVRDITYYSYDSSTARVRVTDDEEGINVEFTVKNIKLPTQEILKTSLQRDVKSASHQILDNILLMSLLIIILYCLCYVVVSLLFLLIYSVLYLICNFRNIISKIRKKIKKFENK